MNGSPVLDTSIVTALFRGDDSVVAAMRGLRKVRLPVIVIGELHYGALKSSAMQRNLAQLKEFVTANDILICDLATTRYYAEARNRLRLKGRPVPDNDLWIAALALQHDLPLVTRDSHFSEVEGLTVETW